MRIKVQWARFERRKEKQEWKKPKAAPARNSPAKISNVDERSFKDVVENLKPPTNKVEDITQKIINAKLAEETATVREDRG